MGKSTKQNEAQYEGAHYGHRDDSMSVYVCAMVQYARVSKGAGIGINMT